MWRVWVWVRVSGLQRGCEIKVDEQGDFYYGRGGGSEVSFRELVMVGRVLSVRRLLRWLTGFSESTF